MDEQDDNDGDEPDESVELVQHDELTPLVRGFYVVEQGMSLLKEGERVLAVKDGVVKVAWPLGKIDELMILGNALVSTALLRHCARESVAVTFADPGGTVRCALDGNSEQEAIELTLALSALQRDADSRLMFARAFADGKIHNQRTILRRYNRRRAIEEVEFAELLMATMQQKLPQTHDLDEVRGTEGQAARLYWGALARFVPPDWAFNGRTRRPPRDPVNTLLSLGYGILHKTMFGLLRRQRLNPYIGMMHSPRAGHAALASDLIEEFRAPIVDTTVLQAVLENRIGLTEFGPAEEDAQPCAASVSARRTLTAMLTEKFRAQLVHPRLGMRVDYHRAMFAQVNHLRAIVGGKERVYSPFRLR